MQTIPVLTTERLALRPFRDDDAPAVARILSSPRMYEQTLSFSTPYPVESAASWIGSHREAADKGLKLQWAIVLRQGRLVGTVSLVLERDPPRGDLGYWIGVDDWNRGYATEAVRAVIAYGFHVLHLPRIEAMCFTGNIASARVLEKAGLLFEELREAHVLKDGVPHDVLVYNIVRPKRHPDSSA
jgi:[ribosomal protein S5]-alanine N-acetyltransferase